MRTCLQNGRVALLGFLSVSACFSTRGQPCMLGDMRACYDGDLATQDVGTCHAGVQMCICKDGKETCSAEQTQWTACEGQITPRNVICDVIDDVNCNGDADARCICVRGDSYDCTYTGPANTENVGVCRAGQQLCVEDPNDQEQNILIPCQGEILPQAENCETEEDENCDGSNACAGALEWSRSFGDAKGHKVVNALAIDANGDIYLTGAYESGLDLSGGVEPFGSSAQDGKNAFLAKFASDGTYQWSVDFSGEDEQEGQSVTIGKDGIVWVAGNFSTNITIAGNQGNPLSSKGKGDIFAAAYAASDGSYVWSTSLGSTGDEQVVKIAVVPSAGNEGQSEIFLAGIFSEPWELTTVAAGNIVLNPPMQGDTPLSGIFLAKFRLQSAEPLWAQSFAGKDEQNLGDFGIDAEGHALLVGNFVDSIKILDQEINTNGEWDVFLVRIDTEGNSVFAQNFGDKESQYASAMAIDHMQNILLGGKFSGQINFGAPDDELTASSEQDMFITKLQISHQLNHVWSRSYSGSSFELHAVGVDDAQQVSLLGTLSSQGSLKFGEVQVKGTQEDLFLLKMSEEGLPIWMRSFGKSTKIVEDMAVSPVGHLLVTGYFLDSLQLVTEQTPTVTNQDNFYDVFLLEFGS